MPSVEPAFDLADLADELDASVRRALLSMAFDGVDDRDDDFAMMRSFSLVDRQITRVDRAHSFRGYGASRVRESTRHLGPDLLPPEPVSELPVGALSRAPHSTARVRRKCRHAGDSANMNTGCGCTLNV